METLFYETGDRVARITLNRPERGNGITPRMPVELAECVERANLDPEVHAIALAGNGSGFCGGYDLVASAEGEMGELGKGAESRDLALHLLSATQGVSVLAHTFRAPSMIETEAARLKEWIRAL